MYTKENPFYASIVERYSLCGPGSDKETQHITLDLSGSGLEYNVGDSVAIYPSNDPAEIERLLSYVTDVKGWKEFFLKKVEVGVPTRKFVQEVALRLGGCEQEELQGILKESSRFKAYQGSHTVAEVFAQVSQIDMSAEELSTLLKPMMPRFYSIASSKHAVGEKMELTVALQQWDADGKPRVGLCTRYLCQLAPLDKPVVPIYIHPHRGFTLPEDHQAPIIMVGPGTGVAPFRAFMQERESLQSPGMSWLFFGEWNRSNHFFYEDYWKALEEAGKLRVDVAFSRDQESKVYVQNRMLANGDELFKWLEDGAYFYVCGDAKQMAKDVDAALHQIVMESGGMDELKAKDYLKSLRREKRYLKDVY